MKTRKTDYFFYSCKVGSFSNRQKSVQTLFTVGVFIKIKGTEAQHEKIKQKVKYSQRVSPGKLVDILNKELRPFVLPPAHLFPRHAFRAFSFTRGKQNRRFNNVNTTRPNRRVSGTPIKIKNDCSRPRVSVLQIIPVLGFKRPIKPAHINQSEKRDKERYGNGFINGINETSIPSRVVRSEAY